ncbi:SUMF1/EgtB/PvdO family nonheme iron enzyme [Oscillatoriales cyanobacterium LEGE 11467]|uniref:SUMF1/EgtB/PvdO family nonheme iron enzyme n=1 Tax=Zarconia navalis LEGE 11467 TaxID=1828826 RepID=A0A928VRS2_9CYAN|nr:SUMF1/EgtB/PvdO family nonheme iron enzyme [Zarconia navalis LEGE 11467]
MSVGVAIAAIFLGWYFLKPRPEPIAIAREKCESDEEFVWIEGGEFIRGSDDAERDYAYEISAVAAAESTELVDRTESRLRKQGWFDRERDRQERDLPAFCIGRNLVTNEQYQTFVRATDYPAPAISEFDYQQQGFLVHPYSTVKPYLWNRQTYPDGQGQHPVVLVSYEDARAYADWKGQQDDRTYSLPSALEWEKAARGTDGRYFPWGNQWYADGTNWAGSEPQGSSEVALYPTSRSLYGVEDMAGNVFEFTSSVYQRGLQRVSLMKGCSWDDLPGFCRGAYQHARPIESRHILFGFRLVRK